MRKLFWVFFLGIVFFANRAEATTGVVEENGRKVGTWVENDGEDKKEKIKVKKTEESHAVPVSSATAGEVPPPDGNVDLEMERRQSWGIVKGMTRARVQEIAALHGQSPENELTESIVDSAGTPRGYLVYEYRFKTEHFEHLKKIYFEPEHMLVEKVLETQEPRP